MVLYSFHLLSMVLLCSPSRIAHIASYFKIKQVIAVYLKVPIWCCSLRDPIYLPRPPRLSVLTLWSVADWVFRVFETSCNLFWKFPATRSQAVRHLRILEVCISTSESWRARASDDWHFLHCISCMILSKKNSLSSNCFGSATCRFYKPCPRVQNRTAQESVLWGTLRVSEGVSATKQIDSCQYKASNNSSPGRVIGGLSSLGTSPVEINHLGRFKSFDP